MEDNPTMIVLLRFMLYCMFTNLQEEGEGVGAAAPHPELLIVQAVDPRMDKAGATTLPEALVRAQGEVPFVDFIYGVELLFKGGVSQ
jgi:hypothetical protein